MMLAGDREEEERGKEARTDYSAGDVSSGST